jgi:hypothetical protein
MATGLGETEFGGKPTKVGIQPPPHVPTPSEQLSLLYRTGDPSGQSPIDSNGDIWFGLRSADVQRAAREAEGAMEKGQRADELELAALGIIADLAAQSAVESV